METIWKFETPFESEFTIKMPQGAKVISVQVDRKTNIPCIWAIVETDNETENRNFKLVGTGHEMKEWEPKYIGTYQYQNGAFVGHLFEI